MAQSHSDDLADFAHQLRQPLSTIEVLVLIRSGSPSRRSPVHQQLRRSPTGMRAHQPSRDGLRTLRAYF